MQWITLLSGIANHQDVLDHCAAFLLGNQEEVRGANETSSVDLQMTEWWRCGSTSDGVSPSLNPEEHQQDSEGAVPLTQPVVFLILCFPLISEESP